MKIYAGSLRRRLGTYSAYLVPEPSAMILAALGGIAMLARRGVDRCRADQYSCRLIARIPSARAIRRRRSPYGPVRPHDHLRRDSRGRGEDGRRLRNSFKQSKFARRALIKLVRAWTT